MVLIDSAEVLRPYLRPEYWDGHSLGHGPTEPMRSSPLFEPGFRRSRHLLQACIGAMAEATPIETYEDGEVLEADEYEPGAVVILRQETLAGPAGGIAADIQEYSTLPIPARPLDVSPSFGSDNNTTKVIKDGKIIYFTTTRWGIVAVNKMGRKVLHTISTEQVDKHDDGKVLVANFTPLTCEFPLQIGETRHFRARRRFFERLKRVNILDIIAYGEAERNLEVSKALQLS